MADVLGTEDRDLLIKNLPKEFTNGDKEELLHYFGAKHVVCMGSRGRLRSSAYATFSSSASARQALGRLHQLEILGQKLVVEFAKSQHKILASKEMARLSPRQSDMKVVDLEESKDLKEPPEKKVTKPTENYSGYEKVSSEFGLNYPRNSHLHYLYPPPNVSIITNIANALICVPKFYVQVLHLMNKLNLPAPFGLLTATPPFPDGKTSMEDNITSSEESEIESDTETKTASHNPIRKRPSTATKPKVKRLRVQPSQLLHQTTSKLPSSSRQQSTKSVGSVFEQAAGIPQHSSKIGVKLADTISAIFEAGPQMILLPEEEITDVADSNSSGFGTFAPANKEGEKNNVEEEDEDEETDGEFITLQELRRNRLKEEETKSLSAFKNYSSGEPTCRLYLKNLAKQVEIKDLRHVFGRFIDQNLEEEKQSFDIRLMKEGRMKGQAFVSFPNEKSAEKALKETHRYLLFGKPLVVQFARSAKPKE